MSIITRKSGYYSVIHKDDQDWKRVASYDAMRDVWCMTDTQSPLAGTVIQEEDLLHVGDKFPVRMDFIKEDMR